VCTLNRLWLWVPPKIAASGLYKLFANFLQRVLPPLHPPRFLCKGFYCGYLVFPSWQKRGPKEFIILLGGEHSVRELLALQNWFSNRLYLCAKIIFATKFGQFCTIGGPIWSCSVKISVSIRDINIGDRYI
jgi:hypothetical protein